MCTTNMNLLCLYTLSRWKNMFTGGIFTNITHKLSTLTDDMLLILPTWVYSFLLLFFHCTLLLFHFFCYCFAVCSSFLFVLIVIANWFFVVLYCVTRAPLLYFIRSWVALSFKVVCQACVTPVQISTLCNISRHECPLLTQYHQWPTATAS